MCNRFIGICVRFPRIERVVRDLVVFRSVTPGWVRCWFSDCLLSRAFPKPCSPVPWFWCLILLK